MWTELSANTFLQLVPFLLLFGEAETEFYLPPYTRSYCWTTEMLNCITDKADLLQLFLLPELWLKEWSCLEVVEEAETDPEHTVTHQLHTDRCGVLVFWVKAADFVCRWKLCCSSLSKCLLSHWMIVCFLFGVFNPSLMLCNDDTVCILLKELKYCLHMFLTMFN